MKSFARFISAAVVVAVVIGCSKSPDAAAADAPPVNPQSEGPAGSGIAPLTTAPVGIAPVGGSETLQGGGSGVGQAMKGRAKDIASGPSSSADGPPPDDDGG